MSKFFSSFDQGFFALLNVLFRNWGSTRAQAAMNKYRDYTSSKADPRRLEFHKSLYRQLREGHVSWDSYDYGEGYYYQGLKALGITGFRDTDARIDAMDLKQLVSGKSVLEIGCNTGFLSLGIAGSASKVTGFDINPYLIEIARQSADYLGIDNVDFSTVSFEDFSPDAPYDCVISFANHSTYDGNTKQSLTDYFKKCSGLLNNGGLFLFESHPPSIEKDSFHKTVELIEEYFSISSIEKPEYGNHMDSQRAFIVATKR